MRWYLGYPVLAAGLAFGAHTFLPSAPPGAAPSSEAERRAAPTALPAPTVVEAAEAGLEPRTPSRLAAFSPGARLLMAELPRRSVLDYLAELVPTADATATASAPTATIHLETAAAWTSVVVPAAAPPPADASVKTERVAYAERVALVRDIQRELRRVGCYWGKIDGSWGGGSKRAVLMFMDRVNASLPSEEPDVFVLSLVRGQSEPVCGATCPQGQSLTAGGRCLPTTLIAQAGKRGGKTQERAVASAPASEDGAAPAAGWETTVATAELAGRRPPFEGRMSIGGPRPDDDMLPAGRSRNALTGADAWRQRTAALDALATEADGTADGAPVPEAAAYDVEEIAAPPPPRPKASASRTKPSEGRKASWRKNYRHVQRLFEHPLGRM